MYVIRDSTSGWEDFALISTSLLNGGWSFIDGQLSGTSVTSWPEIGDFSGANVGDFIALRVSESGLNVTDVIKVTYTSVSELTLTLGRLGDGYNAQAWDTISHSWEVGITVLTSTVNVGVSGGKVTVYVLPGHALITVTALGVLNSGTWIGYLKTFVLSDTDPAPILGSGIDSAPGAVMDVLTEEGSVFSDTNGTHICSLSTEYSDNNANAVTANPIQFGGLLPRHVLIELIVLENTGTSVFPRGICSNLYSTSESIPFIALRLPSTGLSYATVSPNLAFGPL